jgi:hypothetical protein
MPSKSKAQHNLMAMVAHDPKAAKRMGISQSVGQEYMKADKGRKFGTGGRTDLQKVNKPKTEHGQQALFKKGGTVKHDDLAEDKKLIKRAFSMHDKQEHKGSKTDLSKLKKGGMAMDKEPRRQSKGEHSVQTKSKRGAEIIKMAKGGTASARADGIAQRGKTKGKMMCGGGMTKGKK